MMWLELIKKIAPGLALVLAFVGALWLAHSRGVSSEAVKAKMAAETASAVLHGVNERHKSTVNALRAELSAAKQAAEAEQRNTEQRWQNDFNKVSEDAQKQIDRMAAGKRAADAVSGQLRQQARILAAACGAGPASAASQSAGAASASAAGFSPGVVLADMFGWADQRAGELAEAFDRARAAGLACERGHDALRGAR